MSRLLPIVGLALILGVALAASANRKTVRLTTVLWGLALQSALALFVLKTSWGHLLFSFAGEKIKRLLEFSFAGSEMVFGGLGLKGGASFGYIFAFHVLPTTILVAALFAILMAAGVGGEKLDHAEVLATGERVQSAPIEVLGRIVHEVQPRS